MSIFQPTTRREFLVNGLTFVGLGLAMPTFLMRAAQAQAADPLAVTLPPIPGGKILVVIEMSGGNDGLNTAIPYTDLGYAKARPVIGIPASDVVKISRHVGLHPNMGAFKGCTTKGQLAVDDRRRLPEPEPQPLPEHGCLADRQHRSGRPRTDRLAGPLLRQRRPLPGQSAVRHHARLGPAADAVLRRRPRVGHRRRRRTSGSSQDGPDKKQQMETLRALYAQGTVAGSNAEFVRNVGSEAYSSSLELKKAFKDYDIKAGEHAKYPQGNGLANGLQTISKLITGGVGTRVYYLSIGRL